MAVNAPNLGDPTRLSWALAIQAAIAGMGGGSTGGGSTGGDSGGTALVVQNGIPNGGFESSVDGVNPDGWTWTAWPAGTFAIDAVNAVEGAKCLKVNCPGGVGNGGGVFESATWQSCSPGRNLAFSWQLKVDNAALRVVVQVEWFTSPAAGQLSAIRASDTLYDSQSNPVAWTTFGMNITPPSDARWFKLKFNLGDYSVNQAGNIWLDDVELLVQLTNATRKTKYQIGGTYKWVCPDGVNVIKVTAQGAGGSSNYQHGAGSGGLSISYLAVTPGQVYTLQAGMAVTSENQHATAAARQSWFNNAATILAYGGSDSTSAAAGAGGGIGVGAIALPGSPGRLKTDVNLPHAGGNAPTGGIGGSQAKVSFPGALNNTFYGWQTNGEAGAGGGGSTGQTQTGDGNGGDGFLLIEY